MISGTSNMAFQALAAKTLPDLAMIAGSQQTRAIPKQRRSFLSSPSTEPNFAALSVDLLPDCTVDPPAEYPPALALTQQRSCRG